jgi:hypothetical protein
LELSREFSRLQASHDDAPKVGTGVGTTNSGRYCRAATCQQAID